MTPAARSSRRGTIGWFPTLESELVRTRWSGAAMVPFVGLVLALLSSGFAGMARSAGSVQELLNWQALYITGLAAPMMGLLAGLAVLREQRARSGGTQWRPVSALRVAVSRVTVLIALSAAFHALCFGGIAVVALVAGVRGSMSPLLVAGVVSWLSSWGLVAIGALAASRLGLVATFLVAIPWQVLGTVLAESPWWWAVPPAWAVRANLPALGIHANATPLEPGDALLHASAAPGLAGGVLLVVLGTWGLARTLRPQERRRIARTGVGAPRQHGVRGSAYGAVALGCRGSGNTSLVVASAVLCALVAAVYGPSYLGPLYTYAILPLGSAVTAVSAWGAHKDSWWTLTLRRRGLWTRLVAWVLVRVAGVSALVAGLALLGGAGPDVFRCLLLWILTGAVLGTLALVLSIRWGAAAALGVAVTWTALGVLIGGDVLAGTFMWVFGLPAWAETALTAGQVALAVSICLVLLAGLLPAIRAALVRHVRHS